MCLGIPGKVTKTYQEHDVLMGKVDFGGVSKSVCLEHVPEVALGEYVLVHVGFALSRLDEKEAALVFDFLESMNELDELQAGENGEAADGAAAAGEAAMATTARDGQAVGAGPPPGPSSFSG